VVGIEDLRGAKALNGLLQGLDAEVRVQAIWDPRIPSYVGTLKGVGRIYQQTYVDTCRVAGATSV